MFSQPQPDRTLISRRFAHFGAFSVSGVLVGETISAADGSWQILTDSLAEGQHKLTAQAVSSSGLTRNSAGLKVTIDTSNHVMIELPASSDTGISDSDHLTNASRQTISGTADAGSTIELIEGGVVIGIATANRNGDWRLAACG